MSAPALSRFALGLALAAILAACGGGGGGSSGSSSGGGSGGGGGGGGSTTQSGTFIDAPVANLSYSASPSGLHGVTDAQGQFNYVSGDTVSFSYGGVQLGSYKPSASPSGITSVTVLQLTNSTDPSNPNASAVGIGQFLGTMNSIAIAQGQTPANSTIFQMPVASSLGSAGQTSLTSLLNALQNTPAAGLGAGLNNNSAQVTSLGGTVTNAATATVNIGSGSVGASISGTEWVGVCTNCGPNNQGAGYLVFNPDGSVTGVATNDVLSGNWSSGSQSGQAGVFFNVTSSKVGIAIQNGFIVAGAGSASAAFTQGGTVSLTQLAANGTPVAGGTSGTWYATLGGGQNSGGALLLLGSDGSVNGLTDGGQSITGNWNPQTGVGSASFTDSNPGDCSPVSISLTMLTNPPTGSASCGGKALGTLSFSRSGTLTINSGSRSLNTVPLLLDLVTNWPVSGKNSISSYSVSLQVLDGSNNAIANTAKTESTQLNPSTVSSTTDNLAVSYNLPSANAPSNYTYQVSVPVSNGCFVVSGASGTLNNDSPSGQSGLPLVVIDCSGATTPTPPVSPPTYPANILPINVSVQFTANPPPPTPGTSVVSVAIPVTVVDTNNVAVANAVQTITNPSPTTAMLEKGSFNLAYPTGSGSGSGVGSTWKVPTTTVNGCTLSGASSGSVPPTAQAVSPISLTYACP